VLTPAEDAPQPAAGTLWRSRTVEGDLGMRWSAPGVVRAAAAERLLHPGEEERLALAVKVRAEDPTFLPAGPAEQAVEARLAGLAATIALRRHARGKDLRRVRLVVGSGGVLRHDEHAAEVVLRTVLADEAGGWTPPKGAIATIDREYVLAAAGLLAADHYQAALSLLRTLTNP
jgi:hypothetical protein